MGDMTATSGMQLSVKDGIHQRVEAWEMVGLYSDENPHILNIESSHGFGIELDRDGNRHLGTGQQEA
jgi:hypothetical protein